MQNQENLAVNALVDSDETKTSVKSPYFAPELTIHGQLERVTQQTGSDPPVGDGGGAA